MSAAYRCDMCGALYENGGKEGSISIDSVIYNDVHRDIVDICVQCAPPIVQALGPVLTKRFGAGARE